MNTIGIILIAICFLGIVLCFILLAEDARANKILEDYNNQREIRKCFMQEGLNIYFDFSNRTCIVCFFHAGASCERRITFAKTVYLYNTTPKGHGLRKLFVEKVK